MVADWNMRTGDRETETETPVVSASAALRKPEALPTGPGRLMEATVPEGYRLMCCFGCMGGGVDTWFQPPEPGFIATGVPFFHGLQPQREHPPLSTALAPAR